MITKDLPLRPKKLKTKFCMENKRGEKGGQEAISSGGFKWLFIVTTIQ